MHEEGRNFLFSETCVLKTVIVQTQWKIGQEETIQKNLLLNSIRNFI